MEVPGTGSQQVLIDKQVRDGTDAIHKFQSSVKLFSWTIHSDCVN